MKRIGILTAGGDTPALNATLHGAVIRANELKIEVIGLMGGFHSLLSPNGPHVHLNPLFSEIPELDPTRGGTILGASRDYIDPNNPEMLAAVGGRLGDLRLDGLLCVGGDGTMNGVQPLCNMLPTVLAPKTIDNDLGLNYPHEADHWVREPQEGHPGYAYRRAQLSHLFDIEQMVNYVTPGYATAVYVSTMGVGRVRTTAESHRRVAIIEVMGRHSGYIALGSAYGQPDLILLPESPIHCEALAERVMEIFSLQRNVVIVCGEGIVDETGHVLGSARRSTDPAGNLMLSGASEALREMLVEKIGDAFFQSHGRSETAASAIFTRKVGHTQRGGRPLRFDRFHAAQLGGKGIEMLVEGQNNSVAVLQWSRSGGFYVDSISGQMFRDQWGKIHARSVHPLMYDEKLMQPSAIGIEYLLPIFTSAIGDDDVEHIRQTLFDSGNLYRRYHSVNTDLQKRIRHLD
jgi:ATP-dependent phosphofructokinase / diphosphate-dependent phosphofructokinase